MFGSIHPRATKQYRECERNSGKSQHHTRSRAHRLFQGVRFNNPATVCHAATFIFFDDSWSPTTTQLFRHESGTLHIAIALPLYSLSSLLTRNKRIRPFQPSPYDQEFLVENGVEIRGSSTLDKPSFVAILDKMFGGCTEAPEPPAPLTEDFKGRRERAALVRMLSSVQAYM